MRWHRVAVWLGICWLTPIGARGAADGPPALQMWLRGQRAMAEGQAEQAIASFQESLRLDPTLARNHLSLAAAYLAQGSDAEAEPHLARYLDAQPDHLVVRINYSNLLLRLGRTHDARTQLERFIAEVQDHDTLAHQHLVASHSRIMEIAQGEEDRYGEHLHRGIGLYLLACRRAELAEDGGPLTVQELLCKAAAELTLARRERPDEARPNWYLHEVWDQLAQQQPALRCLRLAARAAPFTYLTPAEQRKLHLACHRLEQDTWHK
jgi:tetratricopeptide (TPR) repeat protein